MKRPNSVIQYVFPSENNDIKSDEWYTPDYIISRVRRVLGEIYLDPASSKEANKLVKAKRYYTIESDGLAQSWKTKTLWMNPPRGKVKNLSVQGVWCNKAIESYKKGIIEEQAMFIVRGAIGYEWFEQIWDKCPNICILRKRPLYYKGQIGAVKGQDQLTSAIFYLGDKEKLFQETFRDIGRVLDKDSYR